LSPDEHTVFVLGAGASLAEAMQRRPKRPRGYPPLDATFFRNADKHGNTALLKRVVDQAEKLGELQLTGDSPPVSLEAHLGRLYFDLSHNPIKVGARAYFEAVTLYAREITATTNWMMGKPGLMKQVIQSELKAGRRVSIVTFNIDLLAENALNCLRKARPGAEWCLNKAYGFTPEKDDVFYSAKGYEDLFDYSGELADILLYKMHGSVNWVFRHRDRHPPAALVSKERAFFVARNERLPQTTLVTRRPKDRRSWYISPLIVPPVYEKHDLIKRHLHDVWDGASEALADASKIVFWGYSFPQADTHARHYFQGLSRENAAFREPITINPDPNAESALWDVLRPKSVRHYRSAQDYLAANVPLS
jgi:hypothetical protein